MLGSRERLVDLGWLAWWGVVATAWCWSAGHELGPTYDEPNYVRAGLENWRNLNHRELLRLGTMPLPAEVQMLPLRLAEMLTEAKPEEELRAWLPMARLGTAVFVWLLLWAALRLGGLYGGTWGGRLAVALVACEPILLGHGSLATTDLAFAACFLMMLAVFRRRRDEPSWKRRLVLPAAWVALTFLAKASALVYVPIGLAMIELERLWTAGWRPWSIATADSLQADRLQGWRPALRSLRDLALVEGMGLGLLLIVCPRAVRGLTFQIQHNLAGHGCVFLMGEYSATGFWYYFPATLAIKLTLPVFVLLALVLIFRRGALVNGALFVAAGLLAATPTFRVQLGVRMVLPIAALLLVGAAAAWGRWWSQSSGPSRALLNGLATACVAWSLAASWLVWPNGMCYTNELFGGTPRGYLALSESNVDWGQGLNELKAWHERHADAPLHLLYFGMDPAWTKSPFHPICPFSGPGNERLAALENVQEVREICRGGYLAASTTYLYGYYHDTPAAHYLRSLKPSDQTSTYLIYDFRAEK